MSNTKINIGSSIMLIPFEININLIAFFTSPSDLIRLFAKTKIGKIIKPKDKIKR